MYINELIKDSFIITFIKYNLYFHELLNRIS